MSFHDIKGHDNIKLFFKRALNSKRFTCSYLFFGPEGVGKGLMATTLAKALNCLKETADACDGCSSCIKIENKNHPDITFVRVDEKKDVIGIEQVRELQRQIILTPYEARLKVFIVQDAHLMSIDAANCLLKTLEEPPLDSVIILLSSRPEEIIPTVKSRCRQIRFGPLELRLRIGLAEKKGFLKEEAMFLSRLEHRDVFSFSKQEIGPLFDYKNRVLAEFDSKESLLNEDSFIFGESKEKMKFLICMLESWFRDIFVVRLGAPSSLVVNSDKIKELKGLADGFSLEDLEDISRAIAEAYFSICRNVRPKLALNDLNIKLAPFRHCGVQK